MSRGAKMTVAWDAVRLLGCPIKFPDGAFHWVNDASIADCIARERFEDVSKDHHRQPGKHHHAARIATLVCLIKQGVRLKRIHVDIGEGHINIEDGNHRFRAYQFLSQTNALRIWATGRLSTLQLINQEREWKRL